MDRRDILGLSTLDASSDGRPDCSLVVSAIRRHRPLLVVPALCAMAYPSLLSLLSSGLVLVHGSALPDSGVIVWTSVVASLTLALAVMLVSFVFERALGPSHVEDYETGCARSIAHLAFATPSLYVGFGNVAYYMFQAPSAAPIAWLVFWALVATIALLGPRASPTVTAMTPIGHRRLVLAHGISASAIVLLFIGPHLVNHVTGFWNGPLHVEVMSAVRRVYRNDIVQPILLALIGFQILSGATLLLRRMRMPSDLLGSIQTMSGIYVGIYILAHATAVFATRNAGTDTNWIWLTYPKNSMLGSFSSLRLIAHYWVGPIAVMAHVACGLRMVLLQHDVSPATANRIPAILVTVGVVVSTVILLALLNVHIA